MTTGKRLVQYALDYKKLLIAGLVLLGIAVAADLMGPMIAKKIIDDHIATSVDQTIDFSTNCQTASCIFRLGGRYSHSAVFPIFIATKCG